MYVLDRNIVLMIYRAEHPDKRDPKEVTLEQFDMDLVVMYDSEIEKQAPDVGIPLNRFTRSILVYFASRSTAQTVKTRVKHACQYFDSVRPQSPEASPPVPQPPPAPLTDPGS